MASAVTSLPVPDSPVMKVVAFDGAAEFHHAVDDLHGLGLADEALKALGRDRLGGGDHLLLDGLALERGFDGLYQPLAVEGLDQKVVGPAAHGLDRHVDRAVGGDHDHGSLQAAFLDEVEDFGAAHIGQAHVEQDQVRLVGGELIEGFLATAGVGDVERLVLEVLFVQRNQRLFVFDEQYFMALSAHNYQIPCQGSGVKICGGHNMRL